MRCLLLVGNSGLLVSFVLSVFLFVSSHIGLLLWVRRGNEKVRVDRVDGFRLESFGFLLGLLCMPSLGDNSM